MRKDIEVHINTGDIKIAQQNKPILRSFQWVENKDGLARYIYGEVEISSNVTEKDIRDNGFHISVPYTPKYKEFQIKIKRTYEGGGYSYLQNPVDGTDWFLVQSGLYGQESKNTYASQLYMISEKSYFIKLSGGIANLYSSAQSDVNIIKANRQNSNMLLKCIPTNNYRYPLTGVGLIRWTKSNINYTRLSETLKREFENDGVGVKNASFDFDTHDLYLELDTTNVDNDGNIQG